MMKTFVLSAMMLVCGLGSSYADEAPKNEESTTDAFKKMLLEKAKEAAGKGIVFAEDDVRKMGDWEYKQVEVKDFAKVGETLNEHGKDRWECFYVKEHQGSTHLLFKRPAISLFEKMDAQTLMKLLMN